MEIRFYGGAVRYRVAVGLNGIASGNARFSDIKPLGSYLGTPKYYVL